MQKLILGLLLVGCDTPMPARLVQLCDAQVLVKPAPGFSPEGDGSEWVGDWRGKLVECVVGECGPSGWDCPKPTPGPPPGDVYISGPYQEMVALCEKHEGHLVEGEANTYTDGGKEVRALAVQRFDGKLAEMAAILFMSPDRTEVVWVGPDGRIGRNQRRTLAFKVAIEAEFPWVCRAPEKQRPHLVDEARVAQQARKSAKETAEAAKAQAMVEAEVAAKAAQEAAIQARKQAAERGAATARALALERKQEVSKILHTVMETTATLEP